MIIGYFGGQGTGKTLTMIKDVYDMYLEGYAVMSNLKLSFPHQIITGEDLKAYTQKKEQMINTNIVVDEVHLWFNARRSMSKKNVIMSYMVAQMRKKGNFLFYTTQTVRKPDVILREETDILHFPELMLDIGGGTLKRFPSVQYDKIPDHLIPLIWVKDRIVIRDVVSGIETYREKIRYFKISEVIGLYDTTYIIGFE